ncbi:hypothetical protein X773_24050 [Mesorhizobium sp. LSJC285A00]|nr:hypothetical protein X773_24050 [Mesorhizobium sp. LSJC285A00]
MLGLRTHGGRARPQKPLPLRHGAVALRRGLFQRYGLRTDSYETNLVLVGGAPFMRLDSFIAVMAAELGWPWPAAKALLLIPRPLRDWLYERIAKNRYACSAARTVARSCPPRYVRA